MTTRYEAPQGGLHDSSILNSSRVTRVPHMPELRGTTQFFFPKEPIAPNNQFAAVMIHDGGSLEIKHPKTGKSYVITDDDEVERATVKMPSGTTLFVGENAAPAIIDNLGTVQYMGPGRTN